MLYNHASIELDWGGGGGGLDYKPLIYYDSHLSYVSYIACDVGREDSMQGREI